ncbi:Z-ring formation inhibitor MciZ [Paenibacillus sp. GCM10027627]|uniref:Z-ring formation inhibitor MciZ n=1 Tax=unclassified Paenibacillus TaxID=185978 RepID=UPI0036263B37
MKQYIAPNHLRLVGKGWEVRHRLSKLASASGSLPLSRYIELLPYKTKKTDKR